MLPKNSYCMEACCELCDTLTTKDVATVPVQRPRVRRSIYVSPWIKATAVVLVILLAFAGVFALLTVHAVLQADVQTCSVAVAVPNGTVLTLPGLACDDALYVSARAYHNAAPQDLSISSAIVSYWGDRAYYELSENGELKKG